MKCHQVHEYEYNDDIKVMTRELERGYGEVVRNVHITVEDLVSLTSASPARIVCCCPYLVTGVQYPLH